MFADQKITTWRCSWKLGFCFLRRKQLDSWHIWKEKGSWHDGDRPSKSLNSSESMDEKPFFSHLGLTSRCYLLRYQESYLQATVWTEGPKEYTARVRMCCMHKVEVEGANNCSEYVGAVNTDSGYIKTRLEPYGIVVCVQHLSSMQIHRLIILPCYSLFNLLIGWYAVLAPCQKIK